MSTRGRAKIRAPKSHAHNDLDLNATWDALESSFREIHEKNASALSYEELYRHAYKVVLRKKGKDLYDRVIKFEDDWLSGRVRPEIIRHATNGLIARRQDGELGAASATEDRVAGERLLKAVNAAFVDHKTCMGMLADVLMYMDRVYCVDHRQYSIYVVAMNLFRERVLRAGVGAEDTAPKLQAIIIDVVLDNIQMEREGDVIEKHHIKTCVNMLDCLYETPEEREEERLYLTTFEPQYLEASHQFYRKLGDKMLREFDAGAYGKAALQRINEEKDRCRTTLAESTTKKIEKVVEDELIKNKIQDLIEMPSGVRFMVDNDRTDELRAIYDLNARVDPQKAELVKAIQKRVVEMGNNINDGVNSTGQTQDLAATAADGEGSKTKSAIETKAISQQTSAAIKWVDDVLVLKDKFDKFWEQSFSSDPLMQTALTRSFSEFINATNMSRSSEYISLFIDENMKRGIKDKTEAEVDLVLEKAVMLLRYIQDKDLFETYYKKHLGKRLLMGKSLSIDVENQMISRMKIELGNNFTLKLEAMFKDMTISDGLTTEFKNYLANRGDTDKERIDLSVHVLTSMTWPQEIMGRQIQEGEARLQCVYPTAIDRIKLGFEQFYGSKHSGRRLTWMPHLGTADIKTTFSKVPTKGEGTKERRHELNVPTYSMIILLLFNDLPAEESLSYEEIQAQTNIPHHDLVRNLQSLSIAPKTRILLKKPMSKEILPTDRFSFNEGFVSKFFKVKVAMAQAANKVEGKEERKATEQKNDDARKYVIEAAIVRIMKQRKALAHAQLVTETLSQLTAQFKPDVGMIKKRIESLIEREYLERDEKAAVPSYRYLA